MNVHDLLLRETGMDLGEAIVERALADRMAACGVTHAGDYLRTISADELQALIELVVVPESWMFRDPDAFVALAKFVRERLARHPNRIVRILSIPCAGGEEPYSIAMALHDAAVPRASILIDAIDLSETALTRARRGLYTRNAFRSADLAFRERHFTPDDACYQIKPYLRDQVNFAQGNLVTIDAAANVGRYDVIFCRNLLIYFDEANTASAVAKLRLMLSDEGMLFAGYSEVPTFCQYGFTPMRSPGAFVLQKERRNVLRARDSAAPLAAMPAAARMVSRPSPVRAAPPAPAAAPPVAVNAAAPDSTTVLARANHLANVGDYAAAAALCHALLKTEPACADAYFILGMISECERKPGAADGYWRRCVYLQPEHYEALCHLALLAEKNGDQAQAANLKQRAARVYKRRDDGPARKPAP